MSEKLVFLMSADEAICLFNQQKLSDSGIEAKVVNHGDNVLFSVYRANLVTGKKILVPESKLKLAKEILNITDKKIERIETTKSKKIVNKIIRVFIALFLLYFFIMIIINVVLNIFYK